MHEASDASSTLGMISIVSGVLGLLGQGCCCIPFVGMLANILVPLLILTSITTGVVGLALGGSGRATAGIGLAIGILDVVVIGTAYLTIFVLYGGLLVAGSV